MFILLFIKIISNKDLGIKFDAMQYIQEPQLSEGLKYRFEGLAYEIFNEETTEFKGFKFQAKFYYNRLQLTRSQYYNNIVAKNKLLKSFNLSTASIIEFENSFEVIRYASPETTKASEGRGRPSEGYGANLEEKRSQ